MRIKICGITSTEHGLAAARLGADFLGFVFVPGTPRYLEPQQGKRIIEEIKAELGEHRPRFVGLFVNAPGKTVERIADTCGLDYVQLCGDESPEYCRRLKLPVFRTLRPRNVFDLACFDDFAAVATRLVLDSFKHGAYGGTGVKADWRLAALAAARYPLMLAGGLTPENVTAAIRTVRPWGVDVSSGVETNGVKDVNKIARFIEAVRTKQ